MRRWSWAGLSAEEDTATTRKVAVVNEAFVKRFFKNQNPIGQHFGPDKIKYAGTYEIIGVVKDHALHDL